jgi:hypothetical protein
MRVARWEHPVSANCYGAERWSGHLGLYGEPLPWGTVDLVGELQPHLEITQRGQWETEDFRHENGR